MVGVYNNGNSDMGRTGGYSTSGEAAARTAVYTANGNGFTNGHADGFLTPQRTTGARRHESQGSGGFPW